MLVARTMAGHLCSQIDVALLDGTALESLPTGGAGAKRLIYVVDPATGTLKVHSRGLTIFASAFSMLTHSGREKNHHRASAS